MTVSPPLLHWKPFAIIAILALSSCSRDFDNEWKKENYEPVHFENVVVMGLSHDLDQRIYYEREAVKELNKLGFQAIEGITLFPQEITELDNNQDSIASIIEKESIDGILVVKILHENDWDFMMPEDYGKFKKLYFRRRSYHTFNANYYERPERYYMVASLYDVHNNHQENEETIIWRASSPILNPAKNEEMKKEFIDLAVEHVVEQHYLD